jgi:hypothetical protein
MAHSALPPRRRREIDLLFMVAALTLVGIMGWGAVELLGGG